MFRDIKRGSARAGYYKRYVSYYVKGNYPVLIFSIIFICGVWIGSSFINSFEENTINSLVSLLNGFMINREKQDLVRTFMSSFTPSCIFIIVLFFCGFCAISQPIIVLIPFFKGLGFGLTAGSMILYFGSNSAFYIAILLLPSTIITTLAIIMCCREALKLSLGFFSLINPLSEEKSGFSITNYCVRFIMFTGVLVAGAVLESGLYYLFSAYIK